MMEKFCNNPKCIHCSEIKTTGAKNGSMEIEFNGERHRIDRYKYLDRNGKPFFLCSWCHNASVFVKSGGSEE